MRFARCRCVWRVCIVWSQSPAVAGECPGNPNALGTSRIDLRRSDRASPLGTMQYRETLPLADKEVVLTFDDGPIPQYSNRVLDTLAAECVKATYFHGRPHGARPFPSWCAGSTPPATPSAPTARTIRSASTGMPLGEASRRSMTASPRPRPRSAAEAVAPFFRIPGLLRADRSRAISPPRHHDLERRFPGRRLARVSPPSEIVNRALARLEAKGKGVLLLHDIQPATVLALPISCTS